MGETMEEQEEVKVVLVTGGSSGIGQATAVEFAKLGYKVAITGRNQERLNGTLDELLANHPNGAKIKREEHYLSLQADFKDEKQVDSIIPQVLKQFAKLDILVNNTGYIGQNHNLLDEHFYQDFQDILQVNLMAAVRLSQLAAPHLIKHSAEKPGILINVSSVADRVPMRAIAYCVSKAGLSMLTKTLANSLEGQPVRVLTVSPGPVRTSIVPDERVIDYIGTHSTLLGRPGHSREVANLIVFLASDKASYMHGCTVDVDGGHTSKLGLLVTEGLGERLQRR